MGSRILVVSPFCKNICRITSTHTPAVKLIQSQLTTLQPNTNYGGTDRKQLMYICSRILNPAPFTLITLFIPFIGGNYHWSLKPICSGLSTLTSYTLRLYWVTYRGFTLATSLLRKNLFGALRPLRSYEQRLNFIFWTTD